MIKLDEILTDENISLLNTLKNIGSQLFRYKLKILAGFLTPLVWLYTTKYKIAITALPILSMHCYNRRLCFWWCSPNICKYGQERMGFNMESSDSVRPKRNNFLVVLFNHSSFLFDFLKIQFNWITVSLRGELESPASLS